MLIIFYDLRKLCLPSNCKDIVIFFFLKNMGLIFCVADDSSWANFCMGCEIGIYLVLILLFKKFVEILFHLFWIFNFTYNFLYRHLQAFFISLNILSIVVLDLCLRILISEVFIYLFLLFVVSVGSHSAEFHFLVCFFIIYCVWNIVFAKFLWK